MAAPRESRIRGSVTVFDDDRGLGEITSGSVVYPFHCVSIAGDGRTIEVGAAVSFVLLHKLGRHEAGDITPT